MTDMELNRKAKKEIEDILAKNQVDIPGKISAWLNRVFAKPNGQPLSELEKLLILGGLGIIFCKSYKRSGLNAKMDKKAGGKWSY
jgi:hypothetical protein